MAELIAATVNRRQDDVVLTWETDVDLDEGAPWLLSADLVGGEDGPIHQFGVRGSGGKIENVFRFDFVEVMNYYTEDVPQRSGNRWSVVMAAGDEVARSGKWTATLSWDGVDANSIEGAI